MKIWQALKEAIASLSANRTRSFLTVLGIVIGVGAVIGVLSLGQGAEASIIGQIESIGTNVIYVLRGNTSEDVTNPNSLTTADATRWPIVPALRTSLISPRFWRGRAVSALGMRAHRLPSWVSLKIMPKSLASNSAKEASSQKATLQTAARLWCSDQSSLKD